MSVANKSPYKLTAAQKRFVSQARKCGLKVHWDYSDEFSCSKRPAVIVNHPDEFSCNNNTHMAVIGSEYVIYSS